MPRVDTKFRRVRCGYLSPLLFTFLWEVKNYHCSWWAHPSHGLHVPHLEVLRSLPYQETAGVSVQVSWHCYQCTLVHWQQANSRWFGSPLLYRPYQITSWEIRRKVSRCGEPLSYAVWQIFTLTERRPESPKARRSGSKTCPGYPRGGHVDTLNRAQLALFDYRDGVFRAFCSVARQMPGYNTLSRGTARTLPV